MIIWLLNIISIVYHAPQADNLIDNTQLLFPIAHTAVMVYLCDIYDSKNHTLLLVRKYPKK